MQDEYLEEKMNHFHVHVCVYVCYGFVFDFEDVYFPPSPQISSFPSC